MAASESSTIPVDHAQAVRSAESQARDLLARLDSPDDRRLLIEENKLQLRSLYPQLARYLGLNEAAYDRFLEVMASQELALREKVARCALDTHCQFPGFDDGLVSSMALEAQAMVGADVYHRFEIFRDSTMERQMVAQLRGQISDKDRLSDTAAERLVLALAEERKQIELELQGPGIATGNFNGVPMFAPEQPKFSDRAAELNGRMRSRAAQVLSSGQLAVYDQLQENAMALYLSSRPSSAEPQRQ